MEKKAVPKYGVVIVAYRSFDRLVQYIKSELPKLGDDTVTVIVNNAATAAESKILAEACGADYQADAASAAAGSARLFLIGFEENLGYAKGNNRGADFLVRNFDVKYLLFSNDDIEIKSPGILDALSAVLQKDSDIKMIGPRVLGLTGEDQSPHWHPVSLYRMVLWGLLPWFRRKPKVRKYETQATPAGQICYWVSGAFFLVDASAFMAVGKFDEATFLYGEEVILAERLKKRHWCSYWLPSVNVIHYQGASTTPSREMSNVLLDSQCHYFHNYLNYPWWAIKLLRFSWHFNRRVTKN